MHVEDTERCSNISSHNQESIKCGNKKKILVDPGSAGTTRLQCTSLMCSCYVASRNSDSKEEESRRTGDDPSPENRRHSIISSENIEDGGFIMGGSDETRIGVNRNRNKSINASSNDGLQVNTCSTVPLKSSLKRSASIVEMSCTKINQGMRKVTWSDAHGKDIAHVHEFEPSEEGELRGVGNSCICAIQ